MAINCPFCDNDVESLHQNSHIIPKWMESKIYNSKHQTLYTEIKLRNKDKSENIKAKKEQSGLSARALTEL